MINSPPSEVANQQRCCEPRQSETLQGALARSPVAYCMSSAVLCLNLEL
jgi:hypothetical protein